MTEDSDQQQTLSEFSKHRVSVITGGPGTGKSFITKQIVDTLEGQKKKVGLCAPTGKASLRLAEATGRGASTIHRMFKGNPATGRWGYDEFNQLNRFDWLIVDEASMIDIDLARNLLRALPLFTNIIFIGDVDQLAPVGPGAFFKDIIRSQVFPVFRLRTNHRQGAGSLIAENALRINQGSLQLLFGKDLVFSEVANPVEMRLRIKDLILDLRGDFSEDFLKRFQVLSPQHKTIVGVQEMNKLLRFWINPNANPEEPFSLGDKIMQMANDYTIGVFNGEIGTILHAQRDKYLVDFADRGVVEYPRKQITRFNPSGTQMALAYCSTVHKFQGSECECGIIILSSSHTWMLTRNLLYTGLTRFKKKCFLLADRQALKRAIRNDREKVRFTKFVKRLTEK